MASKFQQVAKVLEVRLRNGDYAVSGVPGERQIALELGVSHMTARRAVQDLVARGLLPRRPVGRIARAKSLSRPSGRLQIAFLAPAFDSPSYTTWRTALTRVVGEHKGIVRPIGYVDWSDATITDTLDGAFDGIFMVPPPMPSLPTVLLERLQGERRRLVTLFDDYTDLGIPCVDMASPLFVHRLAEHLAGLGHRRVHCFNAEPLNPIIQRRIEAWQAAAETHGLQTRVIAAPPQPQAYTAERAYRLARELFHTGGIDATALFCTTTEAARGVMRAAYECDIRIGRDLSLCSCDAIRQARLMTPSLTTLRDPDPDSLLRLGLQWILTGGEGWERPLWIHPQDIPIWIGESTGPSPDGPPVIRRHPIPSSEEAS